MKIPCSTHYYSLPLHCQSQLHQNKKQAKNIWEKGGASFLATFVWLHHENKTNHAATKLKAA